MNTAGRCTSIAERQLHWVVETKDGPAVVIVAHVAGIIPLARRATILLVSGRALDVEHTVEEIQTWVGLA